MAKQPENQGGMSVREAGRKGGNTVKQKYGPEFYSEIGHKGGETVLRERGPEFFSEIGHKGGQKVKELIEEGKRRTAK
ncbi:Glucose starvation-inducible protein B [compost metagenome]